MADILLVEDDLGTAGLLEHFLESQGHSARVATNGAEALLAAHLFRPDIIFMDLMMPVLDGISTIKAFRNSPETHEVPIVVVSVRTDDQALADALYAGANLFLNKPPDPAELLAIVDRLVKIEHEQPDAP